MTAIAYILQKLPPISFSGNKKEPILSVIPISEGITQNDSLTWCSDKNKEALRSLQFGTLILSEEAFLFLQNYNPNFQGNCIVVAQPRAYFAEVLRLFFMPKEKSPSIDPSASIASSAVIGKNVYIGKNVVIEDHVTIGDHVVILHNSILLEKTIVGNFTKIGCNCTLGGVGFGYEKTDDGSFELIPHIGNVVLHEHVEIGNNVCIDRAVLGSTVIGAHVKIDNLVHIAHGVKIGKNSLIIANAMIAGSVEIGENVWVAPSASIIQKKKIGNGSTIGLGSVVIKDVADETVVAGVPAKEIGSK